MPAIQTADRLSFRSTATLHRKPGTAQRKPYTDFGRAVTGRMLRIRNEKCASLDIGFVPSMSSSNTAPDDARNATTANSSASPGTKRRGAVPAPIIEFPEPLFSDWIDPASFHEALSLWTGVQKGPG